MYEIRIIMLRIVSSVAAKAPAREEQVPFSQPRTAMSIVAV